ncbi:MAG: InlB B-repeat-containing protein [Clostridia bacterium]|nr:InlB B-repeat-containing protein [Clostridia bacterium]
MQKTFIRKPISALLALLMVLSMFAGMTFTSGAAAVTPKYKITINSKAVANNVTLPYTTSATNLKNKAGYSSYTVTFLKVYRAKDKIGSISGQNFTITKSGSEQLDIGLKKGSKKGHITPTVTCTPLTGCVFQATGWTGRYDGEPHTIEGVTVTSPESGATVKYGTVSGTYNLTEPPTFTDVGTHTIYYQVSASGWVTKTGSVNVNILGNVYYIKQNPDGTWPSDATGAEWDTRSGDDTTFSLTKAYEQYSVSGWSTAYTITEADRTVAHQGETASVGSGVSSLYVYYSVDKYALTFYADREGQTVYNTTQVGYGRALSDYEPTVDENGTWSGDFQLSDRNSELFTFGGWATEAGKTVWTTNGTDALAEAFDWTQTMPAQNVSLYPVWVANYIHVILDAGAWDQYNTYTQGKYDPATPVSMDQSQGRAFWKSTNITAASTDYDKYVNMEKMNAATRTGFTLDGWYTANGMKWEPTYLIAREYGDKDANGNLKLSYDAPYRNYTYTLTLTARWKLNDAAVSYDVGAGSGSIADSAAYAVGSNITVTNEQPTPPADTDAGRYEFKGWQDKNGAMYQPGETIAYTDESLIGTFGETNEITLTAVYQFIPTASLNFDSQGGSLIDHIEQDVGTAVSLETVNAQQPARVGYTFAGWYEDSDCTAPVTGDITIRTGGTTIYAKWTVNSYTLSFDTKGGTAVESITLDYATAVTAPAEPTRTGYTFTGWDKTVPTTMPAGDMTFNATWQVNTHTVAYDTNGGDSMDAQSRNYGEFVVQPVAPTWEGHTFIRWDYEAGGAGAVSFPFTMPDEDVTLKAVWKENQTAPGAPAATADVRTVTLTCPAADEEYILVAAGSVITEDDWANARTMGNAEEITFDGLVPNTAYDVYARKIGTEEKMPSPASTATTVTTLKADQNAPASQPAAEALLTEVVVDPTQDDMEYIVVPHGQTIPADAVWTTGEDGRVVFEDCDPYIEYDVYARMKETERQNASAPSAAVTVKGMIDVYQPIGETGLTYTGEPQELVAAPSETPDGYTVQYSLDGGTTWTTVPPTGTEVGDYTVKVKYVGNDNNKVFYGSDISVAIDAQTAATDSDFSVDDEAGGTCPLCGKDHSGSVYKKFIGIIHAIIIVIRWISGGFKGIC